MITAEEIQKLFSEVNSLEEANSLRNKLIEEHVNSIKDDLINEQSGNKKRDLGKELNFYLETINKEYEKVKFIYTKKTQEIVEEDLSVPNHKLLDYSFNPLEKVKEDLINFFSKLDFPIESGKEIVDKEDNFKKLHFPKNHPSMTKSETFYLDEDRILRPHCTVSSVNYLCDINYNYCINKEFKVAVLGPVYRRDGEDSSHVHQFTQLDFLWVKKNITFEELKDFLRSIVDYLFKEANTSISHRFRSSYFPFTKPSIEMDVTCVCNSGMHNLKCKICKGTGWVEVLGAGMLNKEILEEANYSDEFECIAGGIGLERIALLLYQIEDIRFLYDNNFDFLKKMM